MPLHPVADNRGKLADLEIYPRIERRVTKKIFVEPNLRAFIGRIEPAIDAYLTKEVKMLGPLGVEKDRQSRIEKEPAIGFGERRRALVDEIAVEIDKPAQLQLKLMFRIANRQSIVDLIEQIGTAIKRKEKDQNRDGSATPHGGVCRSCGAGRRS